MEAVVAEEEVEVETTVQLWQMALTFLMSHGPSLTTNGEHYRATIADTFMKNERRNALEPTQNSAESQLQQLLAQLIPRSHSKNLPLRIIMEELAVPQVSEEEPTAAAVAAEEVAIDWALLDAGSSYSYGL